MNWLKHLFSRRQLHADLAEEIQEHLAEKVDELTASGMSREEATFAARREFGNVLGIEERSREVWQWPAIENFLMDVRYGLRQLHKNPGFTTVAVLTLGLGIGANTAIFSLINALILRSLPVRDPQQLVAISTLAADAPSGKDPLSLVMLEEIQKRQQVFTKMFAWSGGGMIDYETEGVKYAASLETVSGDYFPTLGVQAMLGRLIGPADVNLENGTSAPVAVISYPCWQRRYNGDPGIIGKTIRIDDKPLTIIGVAPRGFTGLYIDAGPDAFAPYGFRGGESFNKPEYLYFQVVGRLKPETTWEAARAQLEAIWPAIRADSLPPQYQGERRTRFLARKIALEPIGRGNSFLRNRFRYQLGVLMGLVGLVLLIACVNLANLTLARTVRREHEMAIRTALGASGWRLLRQLVLESCVIAVAGALLGLAFASSTARVLANFIWTGYIPLDLDLSPDFRVLAFTAGVAGLTTLLSGLVPAWLTTRIPPAGALQQNVRTGGGGVGRFNRGLIVAQVSLSLTLVVGSTLLVRSLMKLRSTDLGYRRHGVLVVQLFPQAAGRKIPNRLAYYRELADRLSRLPGVESVSYSHMGPVLSYDYKQPVSIASSSGAPVDAVEDWVGPGFFNLMGMRVIEGREFDWRDDERAPHVAIISENLARELVPGASPIGRRIEIRSAPNQPMEIVGVVNNASLWKVQSQNPLAFYVPLMQDATMNEPLIDLRTAGDPRAFALSVRQTIEPLGHHFPLRMQTLDERMDMFLSMDRMASFLAASFAGLALVLVSIGLYGIMSQAVFRRIKEIGVRRALGADPHDILWMITREAFVLVIVGVVIGLPGAWAAGRLVSTMLFGLKPTDLLSFSLAGLLMIAVALAASFVPARRATKVDPMVALRYE